MWYNEFKHSRNNMSALNVPANKNFLSPLGFRFSLTRAPNLNFNVQDARIPGLQLSQAESPTPFVSIPIASHITYNPLSVSFRVSEDLDDYLEIHNWMVGLGAPESFDQYKALKAVEPGNPKTVYSDITLLITNSAMRPNIRVKFIDAFPISIGDLQFNTTDTDVNYMQCTVDFEYLRYTVDLVE
jgi:hypothetical protein